MKLKRNVNIPIKAQCHQLIELIWNAKKPNTQEMIAAYKWLHQNTNIKHFATENDFGQLFIARKALQAEAIKRELLTFDDILYMDDKIL